MKKTTLREILQKDIDRAFSLKLVAFTDYERSWSILTIPELEANFSPATGHYAPRDVEFHREFLDLPLYLPEDA
jgi:hypothetical protein